MSVLIELSDDEIRGLTSLMGKLNIPISFPVIPTKKLTKLEQTILSRNEYRAKKKRNN